MAVKRHPVLTLALVVDLMFAGGVILAVLMIADLLGGEIEEWESLAVAGGAVVVDALGWFHLRWALLLRAGGAFAIAAYIAQMNIDFHFIMLWVLVGQQAAVAPVFLLGGWLRR